MDTTEIVNKVALNISNGGTEIDLFCNKCLKSIVATVNPLMVDGYNHPYRSGSWDKALSEFHCFRIIYPEIILNMRAIVDNSKCPHCSREKCLSPVTGGKFDLFLLAESFFKLCCSKCGVRSGSKQKLIKSSMDKKIYCLDCLTVTAND